MDNLFQILAVIFIVYSILSPLFNAGKDKKNRTQTGQGKPGPLSSGPVVTGNKKSSPAANRTAAGTGKPLKYQEGYARSQYSRTNYTHGSRPVEIPLPSGTYDDKQSYDAGKQYTEGGIDYDRITSYDQLYSSRADSKTAGSSTVKQPDVNIQQRAGNQQQQEQNIHMIDVRKMLKNPATLQEIILLSEIVSKPRAYHRKPGL